MEQHQSGHHPGVETREMEVCDQQQAVVTEVKFPQVYPGKVSCKNPETYPSIQLWQPVQMSYDIDSSTPHIQKFLKFLASFKTKRFLTPKTQARALIIFGRCNRAMLRYVTRRDAACLSVVMADQLCKPEDYLSIRFMMELMEQDLPRDTNRLGRWKIAFTAAVRSMRQCFIFPGDAEAIPEEPFRLTNSCVFHMIPSHCVDYMIYTARSKKHLGRGTYSSVSQTEVRTAPDSPIQTHVFKSAQKSFKGSDLCGYFMREVSVLQMLEDLDTVPRFFFSADFRKIFMETGKMNFDEIIGWNRFENRYHYNWNQALEWMRQLCVTMAEAHRRGIAHRDLKPANLVLSQEGNRLMVIDWSSASLDPVDTVLDGTSTFTTVWYRAPEDFGTSDLSYGPVDVWSAGCIMVEMMSREPLFRVDEYVSQQTLRILHQQALRNIREDFRFAYAWPLLHKMLSWNPEARPTFDQVLKDPFWESPLSGTDFEFYLVK